MPNIQQVMSEEIRRLARKELKTELTEMKKQFASQLDSMNVDGMLDDILKEEDPEHVS